MFSRRSFEVFWGLALMAMVTAPPFEAQTRGPEEGLEHLPGTWQVRVEGLSLWAPQQTLKKSIGMTFWKLSIARGRLTLEQYSPEHGTYISPDVRPQDLPFEETEIGQPTVRGDLVAFELECVDGAVESYRLEQFSADRIVGTYTVHDCHAGVRGGEPIDSGRLVLERLH